jgi:Putative prokaryotic signal transducing protein
VTLIVRIGIAASPIEMEMRAQCLQNAGIQARVQGMRAQVGGPSGRSLGNDYSIELWVRSEDEEEARVLLALPE